MGLLNTEHKNIKNKPRKEVPLINLCNSTYLEFQGTKQNCEQTSMVGPEKPVGVQVFPRGSFRRGTCTPDCSQVPAVTCKHLCPVLKPWGQQALASGIESKCSVSFCELLPTDVA